MLLVPLRFRTAHYDTLANDQVFRRSEVISDNGFQPTDVRDFKGLLLHNGPRDTTHDPIVSSLPRQHSPDSTARLLSRSQPAAYLMFCAIGVGSRVCPALPCPSGAAFSRTRQAVIGQPIRWTNSVAYYHRGPTRGATNITSKTPPLATPHRQPSSSRTDTLRRDTTRAMSSVALVESAKRAAAYRAVDEHLDASHHYVGIGSGSTVVYVVDAIAAKGPEFHKNMMFFPTGSQSKALIRSAGLTLCSLPDRPVGNDGYPVSLDVAFDGADEVDAELNCIKGGGGCLLQEKGVAMRSKKFIVVAGMRQQKQYPPVAGIADETRLPQAFGTTLHKVDFGHPYRGGSLLRDGHNSRSPGPRRPCPGYPAGPTVQGRRVRH